VPSVLSIGPQAPGAANYRTVSEGIRGLMRQEYGMRRVSIRAIHSEASRLSVPIKLAGRDAGGRPIRYFAKLIGSQDVLTEWLAQFAKNVYLQMAHQAPLFGFARTAEEMAREEYEGLLAIYRAGVATAQPYGYHEIADGIWLFVAEFLPARPLGDAGEFTPEQVDELFRLVHLLHKAGVYHGDLKTDNILVGDRIYLIDAGLFRDGVRPSQKEAYDLACLVCTFLGRQPLDLILQTARRYYSLDSLRGLLEYTDLIQKRQDFAFDDRQREQLRRRLTSAPRRSALRAAGPSPAERLADVRRVPA
jgi:hypothetical protein